MGEDEVGRGEGHRQPGPNRLRPPRDPARHHELPEPEVPEVQLVELAALHEAAADVDRVVHAVGPQPLEVVREHRLRQLLFRVEIRGHRVGDQRHAVLVVASLAVHGAERRVERRPVRLEALPHGGTELGQVGEERLDVPTEERQHRHLVARRERRLDLACVPLDPVAGLVEDRERAGRAGGLDHVEGQAEVRAEVRLRREIALDRRPPDVRRRVQRVDVPEHDRLELRRPRRRAPRCCRARRAGTATPPRDGSRCTSP